MTKRDKNPAPVVLSEKPLDAKALEGAALAIALVYAHLPKAYDYMSETKGGFASFIKNVGAAKKAGLRIEAVTPAARSNSNSLQEIPALLARLNINVWRVAPASFACRARAKNKQELIARFAVASRRLGLAAKTAFEAGINFELYSWPLCLLPAGINNAKNSSTPLSFLKKTEANILPITNEPLFFPEKCSTCELKAECPGFESEYISLYGDEEAVPFKKEQSKQP